MSRKHEINKYLVLDAEDSTTDPESVQTDVSQVDKIAYDITVAAGVIGTLEVQFCNDRLITNQSVFNSLDFGTPIAINGGTDTVYRLEIDNESFKWMKLKFTDNAGTGNITASITGTTIGA